MSYQSQTTFFVVFVVFPDMIYHHEKIWYTLFR